MCIYYLFRVSKSIDFSRSLKLPFKKATRDQITKSPRLKMCHESQNFALLQSAPQCRGCLDSATYQTTRSCNAEMDGQLTGSKPASLPAPKSFTRGARAQRCCPMQIQNPTMDFYAAHRATVGRSIAASESAGWISTESSSWDEALELLL